MGDTLSARATSVDGGVRLTSARLNGLMVNELVFPAEHRLQVDPERGYVGFVLEGAFEKTFVGSTRQFAAGSAFTMPPGAFHTTRFGHRPSRVVVLHPVHGEASAIPWERLLGAFRETAEPMLGRAWRLAGELRARDDAWAIAAEGLCLELVAGFLRIQQGPGKGNGSPPWLEPVRERLHERVGRCPSLGELAALAKVHPVHLARRFREHHGVSVGEYVRRLRLDWAAAKLAGSETPIAVLAAQAGFADQSHFTRAFKRHTGLTPARYRRALRS